MERSETRKADRDFMAQFVYDLGLHYGAKVERSEFKKPGDHRIEIELNGLRVGVDFERNSGMPNNFCVPWNTKGTLRLKREFGDVNTCHFGKATHFAMGFDALVEELHRGLKLAKSGDAFQWCCPFCHHNDVTFCVTDCFKKVTDDDDGTAVGDYVKLDEYQCRNESCGRSYWC